MKYLTEALGTTETHAAQGTDGAAYALGRAMAAIEIARDRLQSVIGAGAGR